MLSRLATMSFLAVSLAVSAAHAQLRGTISIDGSSTVYPITEGVAEEFSKKNPQAKVTVGVSGTGGGFKRFTKGETDISNASRPIKKEEVEAAKANNVEFIELPIAYDGLSVVVNKSNSFVKQITVDELKKIYLDGGIKSWKELNSSYPDVALKIFSPGTDSGTFDYMKEVLTHGDKNAKVRSDMQVSEDDNVLVTGVEGEAGAVGYFGSAYFFENKDKLRALPVVNKQGKPVEPTPETIRDGTYNPMSRPLFIYVNKKSLEKPEVKAFVEYYLDKAGDMADQVGYVELPDEMYDRVEKHLKAGTPGTQFLTDDGKPKEAPLAEIYKH